MRPSVGLESFAILLVGFLHIGSLCLVGEQWLVGGLCGGHTLVAARVFSRCISAVELDG